MKHHPQPGREPVKYYNAIGPCLKEIFGCRVMKLSIDGGFTCPNRDGTAGSGGCIFCSENGSGEFAGRAADPIKDQLGAQVELLRNKWPEGKYIAYFQNYTNTYGPVDLLRAKYEEALSFPGVVGLAIATRPDCLGDEVLSLLRELNDKTFLWVELGLQTIHPHTSELINRCYPLAAFDKAVEMLAANSIRTVVHLILGLLGESHRDMIESAAYVSKKDIFGIKLHLLHILKKTPLAELYEKSALDGNSDGFRTLDKNEYISLVADILEILPESVTIHRLTGDGPKALLISPLWSSDKISVLNGVVSELKRRNSRQGNKSGSFIL